MPGLGRSAYWWSIYEKAMRGREATAANKQQAAISASIAEKRHRTKRRRK